VGNIEDLRKVIQDFVAPDLKALGARVDGLEKTMNARFDAVNARFDAVDATMAANYVAVDARFDAVHRGIDVLEKRMEERFQGFSNQMAANQAAVNARFDAVNVRFDAMAATMAANHAAMMQALDLERRLAKLESQRLTEVHK